MARARRWQSWSRPCSPNSWIATEPSSGAGAAGDHWVSPEIETAADAEEPTIMRVKASLRAASLPGADRPVVRGTDCGDRQYHCCPRPKSGEDRLQ